MMRLVRTFGDNVRDVLLARAVRNKDLAEKLNTTPDRVTKLLDAENPELRTIFWVAKSLEISVETLCTGLDAEYDAWWQRQGVQDRLLVRVRDLTEAQQLGVLRFLDTLFPAAGSIHKTHPEPSA